MHPAADQLGEAAAQALPYASALPTAPGLRGADELLWLGTAVVGAAAAVLGRPAVCLAVAAAAGAQYLLLLALSSAHHADRPVAITAALVVGALAGLAAWLRSRRSERLARTEETSAALQHAALHPVPARLGELHLAALYRPATADTGIGGDFLEAVHTPYGTRLLIGDVRGKGLQAVQTVTDLLGCFRSQAHETADLGELVARLDRQAVRAAAARGDDELFATALVLEHRGGSTVDTVNCGHLAPLAVGPAGAREVDVPALLPLGLGALGSGAAPAATRIAVQDGETLVLHTDGLSEARNSSGEFYRSPNASPRRPSAPTAWCATSPRTSATGPTTSPTTSPSSRSPAPRPPRPTRPWWPPDASDRRPGRPRLPRAGGAVSA
ncbi:PP2C family protein-serine/threonine phosphatase [Kitasatospora arboriphila]|uniref:PPM-type phosphatase domain-containing protein n=1 Tax=Kitasatospora arboriphila TaxID=258052 RepID=A0ABP4E4L7_9ACTN